MTIPIAGVVRVPPETLERFRPRMAQMAAASRAAWPQFGVTDRRLTLYEVAAERAL
jgi:hypothetical protein